MTQLESYELKLLTRQSWAVQPDPALVVKIMAHLVGHGMLRLTLMAQIKQDGHP